MKGFVHENVAVEITASNVTLYMKCVFQKARNRQLINAVCLNRKDYSVLENVGVFENLFITQVIDSYFSNLRIVVQLQ